MEETFDIDTLLQDISGPNNNDGEKKSRIRVGDKPLNWSSSQFYKDDINAGAPTYPGNKNYTMTLNSKFLHFKNTATCSEKVFNLLLVLLSDVLRKDKSRTNE